MAYVHWLSCIDRITVKNQFSIPRLDDMLDLVSDLSWFSKHDLWSDYHQVCIHEGNEWKTSFKNKDGFYEWLVMPFGLTNALATFMRLMNQVLKPFLGKFLVIYFIDILIFSRSRDEHLQHLHLTFEVMRKERLLNSKKCFFLESQVHFLGFIMSK